MLNLYAITYRVGKETLTDLQPAMDAIRAGFQAKRRLEEKHGKPVEILEVTEMKASKEKHHANST